MEILVLEPPLRTSAAWGQRAAAALMRGSLNYASQIMVVLIVSDVLMLALRTNAALGKYAAP
jgi:hypothetical protein